MMLVSRRESIDDRDSRFWTEVDEPRPSTHLAATRKRRTPAQPGTAWVQTQRKRQLEVVLVFSVVGLLLVGSNFAAWALWPSMGLMLVSGSLWVKRNFFS